MIISVTERGTFKRCRQMWDYASYSRQGLTAMRTPTALAFGTLVHRVHELWFQFPDASVDQVVAKAASETRDELVARYVEVVGVGPNENELNAFYENVALCLDMFRNYKAHWGGPTIEGFTLVKPEQTVVVPIPGTEHECPTKFSHFFNDDAGQTECGAGECDGSGIARHYLEGTFDGLLQDEGGRWWIIDHKTYNSKPRVDALQMNDQFLAYDWIMTQLDLGEVGGVIYNGMWKRFLEKRSLDDLFHREFIIHAPEEIAGFGAQLRDEVLDMVDARIYRNRRWEGCWDCQFTTLCIAESREEDADSIRSTQFTHRKKNEWQESQT